MSEVRRPCHLEIAAIPKILIRSVNWIGDAVMTTPAIGVVREQFPKSEITLLANPLVSELFTPHEFVDRVITFDSKGAHKGIIGRLRLAGEIRRQNFDVAIILPNSFDSALVPWLAGIPVRLGKRSDGRSLLLTHSYAASDRPGRHEVKYYLDLLGYFGIKGRTTSPNLTTTHEEERHAATLLNDHGIGEQDFVLGINPGASYGSAKRWYPERFADLALRLAKEWNAKVIVFGSTGEKDIAAAIEQLMAGNCLNLCGSTGVRELMALIRRCDFFITNDSGPMHIAAAFGVPLVAIFGPTDHKGTSPYNCKATVVRKDVPCAPCKLRECPTDHRCMIAVTADDVVEAAIALRKQLATLKE